MGGFASKGVAFTGGGNLAIAGQLPAGIAIGGSAVWQGVPPATWEYIGYCRAIGSAGYDTFNSTGAELIVVGISDGNATTTFTDNQNNTWQQVISHGTDAGVQIFYCINPVTSATHTFNLPTSTQYPALVAAAFKAGVPFQYDQSNVVTGTALTIQLPSMTVANNSLAVTIGGSNWTFLSIDSGFTIIQVQSSGGGMYAIASAYNTFAAATTIAPIWTKSNVYGSSIGMISFKPI